jgi:hypothetical protein
MPPVVPERDVDLATAGVRRALLAYSKDLNDIFKHYRCAVRGLLCWTGLVGLMVVLVDVAARAAGLAVSQR